MLKTTKLLDVPAFKKNDGNGVIAKFGGDNKKPDKIL